SAASGPRRRAAGGAGGGGGPPAAVTPAPDIHQATPLVEAAIVDEPELLDDPSRGAVVGAGGHVNRGGPREVRGGPDHAGERRSIQAAPAEPGVSKEVVHDGRAGRQGPPLTYLVHERAFLAVHEPPVVHQEAVLDARIAVVSVRESLLGLPEERGQPRLPAL